MRTDGTSFARPPKQRGGEVKHEPYSQRRCVVQILSLTRCVGEVWHLCSIRAFVRSLPLICKTVAREALESLYESMHGAIWRLKFNWLSESRGVCNWQGV